MISEDARERMRRSYYLEKKSLRQIAREEGYCRETIKKAISDASPRPYHLHSPRSSQEFFFLEQWRARFPSTNSK